MLNSSEVKNRISKAQIFSLLDEFGAEPVEKKGNIEAITICHAGDSHKLIYYSETKMFMCYTNCGSMDIFGLIQKIKEIDFTQAMAWVVHRFGLSSIGIIGTFEAEDEQIVNPALEIQKRIEKYDEQANLKTVDEKILNSYYKKYYDGWINEGISIKTMEKFDIRYSILNNQIIIPHRDEKGKLVGIRGRNLDKSKVEDGKKYMPVWYEGRSLRYPTGDNLYGLYQNRASINRTKKVVLFEAEKSVMKLDGMYKDNFSVCLSGSYLTDYQAKLLDGLKIDEVIVGLDKEFPCIGSPQEKIYADKISSIFQKLKAKYTVSVLWDLDNDLNQKDSPVDQGKKVFQKLLKSRIYI